MCVQEEERIKRNYGGGDSVNMAKHHQKKKNFTSKPYAPKKEDKGKAVSMSSGPWFIRINASGGKGKDTIRRTALSS
jgi:hypothetical protein